MSFKPLFAVLGDLHFGQRNFNKDVFHQQLVFLEEQFFPFLLENNIKMVVQVGDLFHDRNKIDWYIFNLINSRFFKWFDDNDVVLHTLVGNHDTYHKSSLSHHSLLETTKQFKNVIVHDTPDTIKFGKYILGFMPWIVDMKDYTLPKCDILFGHFDILNFPMMKGIHSREGLNPTEFAEYNLVLSGHYHTRYIYDNIHMVGTPYQLSFNDFDEDKGFYVLDDKFNYQYIDNTVNPKFVKMYYDDGIISCVGLGIEAELTKEEAIDIVKTNYCRLFVKKIDDQLKLETFHASLVLNTCANFKIEMINMIDLIEDCETDEFNEKFEDGEETFDLIMACIEGMTFDQSLEKELLKDLIKDEYKTASDMAMSIGDE